MLYDCPKLANHTGSFYFLFILHSSPSLCDIMCVADVTLIYLLTTLKMFMSQPLNPGIRYLTTYLTSKHTCILIILIASNICVVSHLLHLSKWQVLYICCQTHKQTKPLELLLTLLFLPSVTSSMLTSS